jgi:DNA repair exonuclease SbcCD ATPase subunit
VSGHVARVSVTNWGCYRGEHSAEFGPTVYAVVGSREGDPESSNWVGKSLILQAVPFALYGRKPPSCRFEDDWITEGEGHGRVEVEVGGASVVRQRRRGKSTQLEFRRRAQDGSWRCVAAGEQAQQEVERLVGLSEEDFVASCFFEQKQMARLVRQRPADFHATLGAWFKLDRLQRCAANASKRLSAARASEQSARGYVELYERTLAQEPEVAGPSAAEVEELESAARKLDSELNEQAAWHVQQMGHAEYLQLRDEAAALKEQIAALGPELLAARLKELRAEHERAAIASAGAFAELVEAKKRAGGGFDGQCPVACASCPSRSWVDRELAENRTLVERAERRQRKAHAEAKRLAGPVFDAEEKLGEARRLHARFVAVRERAAARRRDFEDVEASGPPPGGEELRARVERAWADARQARLDHERAEASRKRVADLGSKLAEAKARLAEAKSSAALLEAAARVFGRGGAQRAVAQAGLAEIEADANEALAAAGVELALRVRWEREGKDLAPECGACGEPIAGKARSCPACGAERGRAIIEEPGVELSDESGAAEDLAGVALQLAAAAWLRRSRCSSWSAAFVDEAFGALDPSNRRKMAAHFASMLGRYGFEQAFVTAHTADVVEAMPGRVLVVAGEKGSSFAPI